MLRDITIGQYYPADSSIHRLDPRVKLAGTVLYLISLFLFSSVAVYIVATIYLGILIWKSNVPLKHIAKGLKPVVFLIVFTALLNLFTSPGEDVIWSFWRFAITTTGCPKVCGHLFIQGSSKSSVLIRSCSLLYCSNSLYSSVKALH